MVEYWKVERLLDACKKNAVELVLAALLLIADSFACTIADMSQLYRVRLKAKMRVVNLPS